MMKQVLTLLFFWTQISFAQTDTLNQTNAWNLRHGYWILYGKDLPKSEHPRKCKAEEGYFLNGQKVGKWIYYHVDGITPKLIVEFESNRNLGFITTYFENGSIMESYSWTADKRRQYYRYYESGCLAVNKLSDSDGKFLSQSSYIDDCDTTKSEYGTLVPKKETFTSGFVNYKESCDTSCVSSYLPRELNDTIARNTRNTIVDQRGEIIFDGILRNGKFWEGKFYKYDSDGILLKIECWRDGKYCCDGKL